MVVYNPMDAKERRTTVRNAGFYAEFDESNSETSESEYNIKKRKMCKTCKMPMLGHKKRLCTKKEEDDEAVGKDLKIRAAAEAAVPFSNKLQIVKNHLGLLPLTSIPEVVESILSFGLPKKTSFKVDIEDAYTFLSE